MNEEKQKSAVERAKEFGIDISLVEENLKRTPTERVEAMLSMLELVEEARRAKSRRQHLQPGNKG
ncbi:MAG: hypothetical protein HY707_12935 [Ignavibacteriae bacterium]|nr:hypothetical protein [Ignavibacteriota bacterium]